MPRAVSVNARPARRAKARPAAAPAPVRDRAAERVAEEAAAVERDRPYIAQAVEWAAGAEPGAMLPLPNATVVGLAAACAAVRAEGFACDVRGCALVLGAE